MPLDALQTLFHPGLDARDDLSLARNDFRFHGYHSGVKAPGLPLRFPTSRFYRPFGLSAQLPKPVRPDSGRFIASGPLQFPRLARLTSPPASTPSRDSYIP